MRDPSEGFFGRFGINCPFTGRVVMAQNPLWHGTSGRNWIVAHAAIRKNERLWSSIAFEGIQADGLGGLIEQRRCPACGSTLARRTTALDAVRVLSMLEQIQARSLEAIAAAGEEYRGTSPEASSSTES